MCNEQPCIAFVQSVGKQCPFDQELKLGKWCPPNKSCSRGTVESTVADACSASPSSDVRTGATPVQEPAQQSQSLVSSLTFDVFAQPVDCTISEVCDETSYTMTAVLSWHSLSSCLITGWVDWPQPQLQRRRCLVTCATHFPNPSCVFVHLCLLRLLLTALPTCVFCFVCPRRAGLCDCRQQLQDR